MRSNLGGLGGRCTEAPDSGLCLESQAVTQANDIREVRFQGIATARQTDGDGTPIPIDLRIVNETEYRAWNIRLNGIKRQMVGSRSGAFGVINLKGPRLDVQSDGAKQAPRGNWNERIMSRGPNPAGLSGTLPQPSPPLCSDRSHFAPASIRLHVRAAALRVCQRQLPHEPDRERAKHAHHDRAHVLLGTLHSVPASPLPPPLPHAAPHAAPHVAFPVASGDAPNLSSSHVGLRHAPPTSPYTSA